MATKDRLGYSETVIRQHKIVSQAVDNALNPEELIEEAESRDYDVLAEFVDERPFSDVLELKAFHNKVSVDE